MRIYMDLVVLLRSILLSIFMLWIIFRLAIIVQLELFSKVRSIRGKACSFYLILNGLVSSFRLEDWQMIFSFVHGMLQPFSLQSIQAYYI